MNINSLPPNIDEIIRSLTLEEKLSQLFIVGYSGYEPDNNILDWVKNYLGGIILFRDNIKSPYSVAKTIEKFQKLSKLGLFVSIDQEGGQVERITDLTQVPTAMALAATDDESFITFSNSIIAKGLSLLGFNLNYTPVLDVNDEPSNPVIGIRAFGDNPDKISKCALKVIDSMRKHSVIPVAKHFPGHGAANIDSHLALPSISIDLELLKKKHLYPFNVAIDHQIEMIMICHVYFNQLSEDTNLPASLSKSVVTELLKNQMGYNGVIITDDLYMNAIQNLFSIEEASEKALLAGVDILLYRNYEKAKVAYYSLLDKIRSGKIPEELINNSLNKILSLKHKYSIINNTFVADVDAIAEITDSASSKLLLQQVFDKTLTLIKSSYPFEFDIDSSSTLILSIDRDELVHYKSDKYTKLSSYFDGIKEILLPVNPDENDIQQIIELIKPYDNLIIITYNAYLNNNQAKLFNHMVNLKKTVLLAAGSPYDAILFTNAYAIVLSYGYGSSSIASFARFLRGEIILNSFAPVNLLL